MGGSSVWEKERRRKKERGPAAPCIVSEPRHAARRDQRASFCNFSWARVIFNKLD
jgi:hypothetical protein